MYNSRPVPWICYPGNKENVNRCSYKANKSFGKCYLSNRENRIGGKTCYAGYDTEPHLWDPEPSLLLVATEVEAEIGMGKSLTTFLRKL